MSNDDNQMREAIHAAIAAALGDAYDCTRVWSAWSYGTMGEDDFSLITDDSDRMAELTDAVLSAIAAPVAAAPAVDALKRIKLRLHFVEMPGESMWNPTGNCWVPDWRYEIQLIEQVLHGSPITVSEKPTDTRKRIEVESTPAAPGIDLEQFRPFVVHAREWAARVADGYERDLTSDPTVNVDVWLTQLEMSRSEVAECDRLLALIDDSCKSGRTAPRFELTNGQIVQLADFAGTPVAGAPLDEQDVLVIQHADCGHSGPGLYAHYDDLPEEGAIHLDGKLSTSRKGGDDDRARFEEWCPYNTAKHPSGHYVNENTWHAWNGWKAAKRATSAEVGA